MPEPIYSEMVGEFPELQGMMGRLIRACGARHASVAEAIEDHYKRKAERRVPRAGRDQRRARRQARHANRLLAIGGSRPAAGRLSLRARLFIVALILENKLSFFLPWHSERFQEATYPRRRRAISMDS